MKKVKKAVSAKAKPQKPVAVAEPGLGKAVTEIGLSKFAHQEMMRYGTAVNEDRAVSEYHDGFKPVQRRVLWAGYTGGYRANKPVEKSARIVGDTLGKFHPHGDQACYGAVVNMVNMLYPLLEGEGNFGDFFKPDSYAAMRYCFTGDTRVMTDHGLLTFTELARTYKLSRKSAQEVELKSNKPRLASLKHPQWPSHLVNSGKQDVVEVRTRNGYNVKCTPNEPFLVITPQGFKWKNAEDLTQTDWLCMKRDHGFDTAGPGSFKADAVSEDEATFLGYMVGDGYLNVGQNYMGFNQVDHEVFKDFLEVAKFSLRGDVEHKIERLKPRSYGKQEYYQWSVNSVEEIRRLSADFGLHQGDSYDRCVPEAIFRSDPVAVGNFLAALYEADGSVFTPSRGSSSIYLHSVSSRLLEDVSLLMRNYFGIFCSSIQPEKEGSSGLRMMIYGSENLRRFVAHVGFRSKRKSKQVRVVETGRSNGDSIPYADVLGLSSGSAYERTQRTTFRAKYEKGAFTSKAAKEIYDRDYYYEQVESVEPAGKEYVFDFCVPTTHAFVANGFIVHNTNVRLSKFSERVFFDPFYMPVLKTVANYDSKQQEPLYLLSLLPNVLFNTTFAIGYGLTARMPRFTLPSVAALLVKAFAGEEVTPQLCWKTLEFTSQARGVLAPADQKKAVLDLFKTGVGRLQYNSVYEVDAKAKKIVFTGFAPFSNFDRRAEQIAALPEVVRVANESSTKDKIGRYAVYFKANTDPKNLPQLAKKVAAKFSEAESYFNNVTVRSPNKKNPDEPSVQLRSTTVPELVSRWVSYRTKLEVEACSYQIAVKDREIRELEVLRIAVANRAVIIKALDKDFDDEQLAAFLSKTLKITVDEAKYILDLKVRQLKALEDKKLVAKMKELKALRAEYDARRKKPAAYCAKHIQELVKEFA